MRQMCLEVSVLPASWTPGLSPGHHQRGSHKLPRDISITGYSQGHSPGEFPPLSLLSKLGPGSYFVCVCACPTLKIRTSLENWVPFTFLSFLGVPKTPGRPQSPAHSFSCRLSCVVDRSSVPEDYLPGASFRNISRKHWAHIPVPEVCGLSNKK